MAESSQPRIFTPLDISELDLEERNCAICQEPMEGGSERAIRLPCSHIFGKRCITEWLLEQNSCPKCRRITLPQPQLQLQLHAQPQTPPQAGGQHVRASAHMALLPPAEQSMFLEGWRHWRVRLLGRLRANRFTPVTKALAFVEEQTSTEFVPDLWTSQYLRAIESAPQMLINGECTAQLERDEILVRQVQQELTENGREEEAEAQASDFDHLARVLRERYIED
ncbi:MAG: hypothetical protein Q9195_004378 [Heterodermia aff. obscurata]